MNFLYAVFFGAGAAAFIYTRMGRRLGYSNSGNVAMVTIVTFIISTIVFYTILAGFLGSK